MEQLLLFLKPLIEMYAGEYGTVVQVLGIIGSLRLMVKPMMSLAHTYVLVTPSPKDDAWLAKFENNKIFKSALYVLDWIGSFKFKKPANK